MRKQFITNFKKAFSTATLCLCTAGVLLSGNLSSIIENSTNPESPLQIGSSEENSTLPPCPITPLNDRDDGRKHVD